MEKTRVFQARNVIHYPRLDTVLMIEDAVRNAEEYPSRMQLWRSLPKKVMYQTFKLVMDYLVYSNKVYITEDGKVMWVYADTPKARKLLKESVKYVRG